MTYSDSNIIHLGTDATSGSLEYIIDGQITVQPASSWAEGLRQGTPDYGNIDHAFYTVMDDFRGGIGVEYARAREDIGKIFESAGVQTWDSQGRIIPAPKVILGSLGAQVNVSFNVDNAILYDHIQLPNNYMFLAVGRKVFRTQDAVTWTNVEPSIIGAPGDCSFTTATSLYGWTNDAGESHLYFGGDFFSPSPFAYDNVGHHRMQDNGQLWNPKRTGAAHGAHDFLEFDKKLWKIYHGDIRASLDGSFWTSTLITIPGPTIFISKFAGVGYSAEGSLLPHVIRNGKLYILDVTGFSYQEVITGINHIKEATVFGDEIVCTDGQSVKLVHPSRPVREIGLPGMKNPPIRSSIDTTQDRPRFLKFLPYGKYLLATVGWGDSTQLWLWDNSSWHIVTNFQSGLHNEYTTGTPNIGFLQGESVFPTKGTGREIHFATINDSTKVVSVARLRGASMINENSILSDNNTFFEATGVVITSWFDGGFADMPGTAIELEFSTQQLSSSKTIKVEYRTDNSLGAFTTVGLTDLGDGKGVVNTSPNARIKFAAGLGLSFTTIQFKITWTPEDPQNTPVLSAIVFKYIKTPRARARYNFTIDTARTAEHRSVSQESVIDTLFNFVDANPLLAFRYVEEGTETTPKFVKIIGMPRRDIASPEGDIKYAKIIVDLIEPVGA